MAKGADMIDKNFQDIRRLINDNDQKNQQQHMATQLQLTAVTAGLTTVTQTVAALEDRVVNTQRAILSQSQEIALGRNLSDIKTNLLNLEVRLILEQNPVQQDKINQMITKVTEQQMKIENDIKNNTKDFLTIVGVGPIGQLIQPPPNSTLADEPTAIPIIPTVPPGLPPHVNNLQRTSDTITQPAADERESSKKRRRNETSHTEGETLHSEGMAIDENCELVCPPTFPIPNTLIATHGNIPDPVMNVKTRTPQMKNPFHGVLDKLRDLNGYCRSRPSSCRSHAANTCPKFFLIIGLLTIALSLIQTAQAAMPMSRTATLSIYALNANGLVQPVKVNHINKVIKTMKPHAFILGETKTKSKLSKSLPYSEYDIYEEPGESAENHHIFKWGIVVGIGKDIQVTQRLEIIDQSLKGRVIALDLILPTTDGRCIPHRLIGSYAPWNPGEEGVGKPFWDDMTNLCRTTTTAWTIAGDLNATITPSERNTGGSEARQQYLKFLQNTIAHNLWSDNQDQTRLNDWTCRSKHEGHSPEGNIIDRVATSSPTLIDTEIYVTDQYENWIPYTDHRAIVARVTHSLAQTQHKDPRHLTTTFARKPSSRPRIKMPLKTEKDKYETFRENIDKLIEAKSLNKCNIIDDDSFIKQYKDLTDIITSTAAKIFGHAKPFKELKPNILNDKIKGIISQMRTIGGAIRFEKSCRVVLVSPKAMKHHAKAMSQNHTDLLQHFNKSRRALNKSLYTERAKEIIARAKASDKWQIASALRGSTKKMINASNFVPLPFALNDLDQPDKLVCDPEGVKATTREYFTRLYDHTRVPEMPKPWLKTKSVVEVKDRITNDTFQWPRKANLADFRALIRKGNHRPSPGPDCWEKWTIKSLSDFALTLVLDLHNYEVMNSCFPGNVKDMWLTTIHKRGLRTDLKNWRGLSFSNFLANSPMTWLNQCLIQFSAEKRILPDTQVAAQPGVQTRDLMSYLAGVKCWANRHKQTIYAIKRDQMKGFDYLSPNGFYDAIRAYGLPESIIDLDKAAQDQV
ncbi:hypothetical protein B0H34DRAFT_675560 [Crassisporium funariophilum]|nr:hypothetical protein B0H34DRAFT_675560 [Crassisporium funariophilum]